MTPGNVTERIALVFEDQEFSAARLDALANGLAGTLARRGVRAGERVALMSSNRPEFIVATHAIWRLGASAVLLSPAWKRGEVEHALAITGPAHAVGDHPGLAGLMLDLDEPIEPGPGVPLGPERSPGRDRSPGPIRVRMPSWSSVRGRPGCRRRPGIRTRRSVPPSGTGGTRWN